MSGGDCFLAVEVAGTARWRIRVAIDKTRVVVGIKAGRDGPTTALVFRRTSSDVTQFIGSTKSRAGLDNLLRGT